MARQPDGRSASVSRNREERRAPRRLPNWSIWLGYLQWHFRTKGREIPPEPILHDFKNINATDAVLTWDGYPVDEGRDARRRKRVETYPNARKPKWPEAEFIVGNPPFIGGKDMRAELGEDYAETLWAVHKDINDSADFVMYWWDRAAGLLTAKGTKLRRFGFVTTNSITQEFSRRTRRASISTLRSRFRF